MSQVERIKRACLGHSYSRGGLNLPDIKRIAAENNLKVSGRRDQILAVLCAHLKLSTKAGSPVVAPSRPVDQPPAAHPKAQPPAARPKAKPPAARPKAKPPAARPKAQPPAAQKPASQQQDPQLLEIGRVACDNPIAIERARAARKLKLSLPHKSKGKILGSGTFGVTYDMGDYVLKQFKREGVLDQSNLREVVGLVAMLGADNVIQLQGMNASDDSLAISLPKFDRDLWNYIESLSPEEFTESRVRDITYKILKGIFNMHQRMISHRDIKPQNIVINAKGDISIIDLGLSRFSSFNLPLVYSQAQQAQQGNTLRDNMTTQIVTLWWRPPELLRSRYIREPEKDQDLDRIPTVGPIESMYDPFAVDIWSIGIILYQLLRRGSMPNMNEVQMYKYYKFHIDADVAQRKRNLTAALRRRAGVLDKQAIDLLSKMLSWDFKERISAEQALRHPYFTEHGYTAEVPKWPLARSIKAMDTQCLVGLEAAYNRHTNLSPDIRKIVVDWLGSICRKHEVTSIAYFRAIHIFDAFMIETREQISRVKVQGVGAAALFLADQLSSIYPQSLYDYSYLTKESSSVSDLSSYALNIANTLHFNLYVSVERDYLHLYKLNRDKLRTAIKHLVKLSYNIRYRMVDREELVRKVVDQVRGRGSAEFLEEIVRSGTLSKK